MLSIEYIKKGKAISNKDIFDAVKEYIEDNYYDNIEKQNGKRFESSDNKITFTLTKLNGGEAKMKSIAKEIADDLSKKGGYNIAFQCITIGSSHKVQFVARQQVEEALKFNPADNGAVASALKIPKDKISDFLSDVSSKFNLKKFKKYSTEFWSQSSGEANSKYYITKSIAGNVHAFINTKFNSEFHKDIEAFKEYLEQKIESYKPEPVEEEEVVAIDKLTTPTNNGIQQEEMTIPMFKNESKFIKEHAVVNLEEMKEIFGGSQVYKMLLDETHIASEIREAKTGDGKSFRVKTINEDKFILEEQVVDVQPEDVINDGMDELVEDEVKPGDEVITKDFHVMYYIALANGAGVLVSPSLNAVKVMMAGMGEPDQDNEDEAVVECRYSDISHFNESKEALSKEQAKKIANYYDDKNDMEVWLEGEELEGLSLDKAAEKIAGPEPNQIPKIVKQIGKILNESKESDSLEKMLKSVGWEKDGEFFKWKKFSTTTEEYLLAINDKDKSYKFIYDPIITGDEAKVKISKLFSFEDYSDIILPSTMDEFDHVMSIKADDLFKKGTTMEYKGKKVKIKKYNFGKYMVKVDGKEEEVDGKDLKPVAESTIAPKYKKLFADKVEDLLKNGVRVQDGRGGQMVFKKGSATGSSNLSKEEAEKLAHSNLLQSGQIPGGTKVADFIGESKYKVYKLKENFEEYYTKTEIEKFLDDNDVVHDPEDWWTDEDEKNKGMAADDAYDVIQKYGSDELAEKWSKKSNK